jgi:hypothetical protein
MLEDLVNELQESMTIGNLATLATVGSHLNATQERRPM